MRPQVGKRSSLYKPIKEEQKAKARLFVESKKKHNLVLKEDFMTMKDVAVAMNMNALEQRMITKQKMLKMLKNGLSNDALIVFLEDEIDLDRHRLTKYYKLPEKL